MLPRGADPRALRVDNTTGILVKINHVGGILLSASFYTALLSTAFVMPSVLAARDDGISARAVNAPKAAPPHDLHLPQSDAPASEPAAMPVPSDKIDPDAAIVRPVRTRAKTIKL